VPLVEAMNLGGRGSSDRIGRVRQALVVAEIAIALLLMTGAGLLIRTLMSLNNVDAGYRADNVVAMNIRLPFRRLVVAMPGEIEAYWRSIEREVAAVPQIRVASLGLDLPLSGLGMRQTFEIVGSPALDPAIGRSLSTTSSAQATSTRSEFQSCAVVSLPTAIPKRRPRSASSMTPSCDDSSPAASRSVPVSRSGSPASAPESRTARSLA
jgi:hypothetical protein